MLPGGLLYSAILPPWLGWGGAALGLAAIAVTRAAPDQMERYRPIFHLNAALILAVGVTILRVGLGADG